MPPEVSRDTVIAHISASVENRAAKIRQFADKVVPLTLKDYGVDASFPSNLLMNEVAYNCAKDLEKIAIYQKDKVDQLKTFGYFGFWIRKIKPIEQATRTGKPFKEVNEYLSIWILGALISRYYKSAAEADASKKPTAAAVIKAVDSLINDAKRMEYIVHCMRSRTFGPHHYVIMLQQITGSVEVL